MTYEEYLLVHLMEEAAEVQKACSKALRFGLDHFNTKEGSTNRVHIQAEVMGFNIQVGKCIERGLFGNNNAVTDITASMDKGDRMVSLSRRLGRITD